MPTLPKIQSIASGPSRHVYDVIVLGAQLGGALAGALLAKRGYRVLLVEHDGVGHGYEHGGYVLPYGPFLLPALKAMPGVEEAFTELGLTTGVQRALRPHAPPLQAILPRHRIDLHAEEPRRLAELGRELGEAAKPIHQGLQSLAAYHEQTDAFFKDPLLELPPDGFFEAWGLKGKIRRAPGLEAPLPAAGDDPVGTLLRGLLPFNSYLDAPTTPVAQGRALSQLLPGPLRYPGGREGLRELLVKRCVDAGGVVLGREGEGAIVEELTFEGGKLVGLKVLQSDAIYRASAVVSATDAAALRRLVHDKKRLRKVSEALDLADTKRYLFAINWVVKADLLPRGMGELLLLATGDDLGPVLIQVSPARRPGKPDDDAARVVCAAAFVPASTRELGEAHLQGIAERLAGHLDALMPFVRPQLLASSAPHLDAGGVRGSRFLPHPLFAIDAEARVGVEGLKQRTAVKNLFLASREVLPGLGLEGELLAGVRATRLVQDTLKKRDPLRR